MASTPNASPDAPLNRLAMQGIAMRTTIEESGTPVMRRLIDLLLFEIGVALAETEADGQPILEPAS